MFDFWSNIHYAEGRTYKKDGYMQQENIRDLMHNFSHYLDWKVVDEYENQHDLASLTF